MKKGKIQMRASWQSLNYVLLDAWSDTVDGIFAFWDSQYKLNNTEGQIPHMVQWRAVNWSTDILCFSLR